jgi:two-component system nitrate/nitrite response regulator NarL
MARSLRTLKVVKRNVEQCLPEYAEDTSSQEVAKSPVDTPAVSTPSQDPAVSTAERNLQDDANTSAIDIQKIGETVMLVLDAICAETQALVELLHKHSVTIATRIENVTAVTKRTTEQVDATLIAVPGDPGTAAPLASDAKAGARPTRDCDGTVAQTRIDATAGAVTASAHRTYRTWSPTACMSGTPAMQLKSFETVLVGPSTLQREGISRILSASGFRIAASAPRVDDVSFALLSQHQSILLIINAGDDSGSAISQIKLFKERHPTGRVAVLADHFQPRDMVRAYRAGTDAYFVKVATCGAFIKALELIMLGETILPSEFLAFMLDPDDMHIAIDPEGDAEALVEFDQGDTPHLSAREKCILRCIVEGRSNSAIARKLNIAESTVKGYVKAIRQKIRAQNRTQAAIWAMNNASLVGSEDNRLAMPATISADTPFAPEAQMRATLLPP